MYCLVQAREDVVEVERAVVAELEPLLGALTAWDCPVVPASPDCAELEPKEGGDLAARHDLNWKWVFVGVGGVDLVMAEVGGVLSSA